MAWVRRGRDVNKGKSYTWWVQACFPHFQESWNLPFPRKRPKLCADPALGGALAKAALIQRSERECVARIVVSVQVCGWWVQAPMPKWFQCSFEKGAERKPIWKKMKEDSHLFLPSHSWKTTRKTRKAAGEVLIANCLPQTVRASAHTSKITARWCHLRTGCQETHARPPHVELACRNLLNRQLLCSRRALRVALSEETRCSSSIFSQKRKIRKWKEDTCSWLQQQRSSSFQASHRKKEKKMGEEGKNDDVSSPARIAEKVFACFWRFVLISYFFSFPPVLNS